MGSNGQSKVVFLVVKGTTIKKYILFNIVTGTGIFYLLKIVGLNIIISSIGSMVGSEGIKKLTDIKKLLPKSKLHTLK